MNWIVKNTNELRLVGVCPYLEKKECVKIQVINEICIICILGWLTNNIYNFFCGHYIDILVAIPLLIAVISPLVLNYFRKSKLSRGVLICAISMAMSGLYFLSGKVAFYEMAFLLIFVLNYYLFEKRVIKFIFGTFVIVSWALPFLYTHFFEAISPSQDISYVVETIFFSCMIGLFLVTKKIVDQSNAYVNHLNSNVQNQKSNLSKIREQNYELELKSERLKEKKEEIELFFEMSSEYLKNPTLELIKLSKSLEKSIPHDLPMVKDVFTIINRSSKRMGELIESVFEYSKIDEESPKEEIDCREILFEIETDLFHDFKKSRVLIQYNGLPTVYGNRTELRMLFQNLITNAIKYSKPNTIPIISIDAEKKENYWKVMIEDNGIGIAKKFQEKVFEMFQKLHNNNEIPGTGIGLAHCKKIVANHRGDIWVDSEEGVGSTFYFTIATKDSYEVKETNAPVLF